MDERNYNTVSCSLQVIILDQRVTFLSIGTRRRRWAASAHITSNSYALVVDSMTYNRHMRATHYIGEALLSYY